MPYLPILTYHRILSQAPEKAVDPQRISVSQDQFRRHCAWLRRLGYRTVHLGPYVEQLRRGGLPEPKTLAITFDDGYEEVWRLAIPVLRQFQFTATLFAVPGEMGGCNRWDDGRAALMNLSQLRDWERAGHEIGAHTLNHVHLTKVTPEQALEEMTGSRAQLEQGLGHSVPLLAYPYGETSPDVCGLAKKAGFNAAFATDHAPRDHSADLYWLRRAVVFPRNSIFEILCKVQPWYPHYQDWKRKKKEKS